MNWLIIIELILLLAVAVATAKAAKAAARSASAAEKTALGQFGYLFLKDYETADMVEGLRILRDYKDRYPDKPGAQWYLELKAGHMYASDLNNARRTISHFYMRAVRLYQGQYVDENFLKAIICPTSGIDLFFDPGEDLEKAWAKFQFAGVTYDETPWEILSKISEKTRANLAERWNENNV